MPSSGHQLPLPSAHHATKPFPKILFSSLIFNQTIKHLNDLVHIQSTLQQHSTAAQEPAQPFPPSQSHRSLIILTAQQHQASLFSFFSSGKKLKISFSLPKQLPAFHPQQFLHFRAVSSPDGGGSSSDSWPGSTAAGMSLFLI